MLGIYLCRETSTREGKLMVLNEKKKQEISMYFELNSIFLTLIFHVSPCTP